ncbi:MAG: heme-binding beta-barrel domain-containing protein [Planctomycetota bacterium]
MPETKVINYGPLEALIGSWKGDKGMDVAPEPDGQADSPYFETLTFTPVGDVTNAEQQVLVALRYQQVVSRKSTGEVFHDQCGYWMWDAASGTVMQSLAIPRAVAVLAGGKWTPQAGPSLVLEVKAGLMNPDWGVIQSPFMRDKAKTVAYRHKLTVEGTSLTYAETTNLDIYGRKFEHTDTNTLTRA